MNGKMDFEAFSRIFKGNIEKRSRTAKGVSNTGSSSKKKKLLKSGDALKCQVAENTILLVATVWKDAVLYNRLKKPSDISLNGIRRSTKAFSILKPIPQTGQSWRKLPRPSKKNLAQNTA